MTVTIQEDFILPSKGQLYATKFDPHVKLRSMTVAEEMKRLQISDTPYKVMSEIIDDCLITKLPISAYDMCLGDYQYLLHKLRIVTYGSDYKLILKCPYCGEDITHTVDLNNEKVFEYDGKLDTVITLPKSGKKVELKLQTPRDLDYISNRAKEIKKNFPDMVGDPAIVLSLQSMIKTIDDAPLDAVLAYDNLKQLAMADMNLIVKKAIKLNEKVGLDTMIKAHCDKCNHDITTTFRYTDEFFGPEVY